MSSQLSTSDQQVLNQIFNSMELFSSHGERKIEEFPFHKQDLNVKKIESEAVKLAENGGTKNDLLKALELLDEAITIDPLDPSPYNNKAQIQRLLGITGEAVFESLNEAIKLSQQLSQNERILRLASAQRGWLNFRLGNLVEASKDFKISSELGCAESKKMLVRCNPYAAMCNQMMHELLSSKTFYSNNKN